MHTSFIIALLGAESTGKTTLSQQLAEALRVKHKVALVSEYLREFCNLHNRTPHADEQSHIANEQNRRIAAAASSAEVVIADTTALMTAVYSDQVFGHSQLYESAMAMHAQSVSLTLVTALDLPWQADGLQRDGAHVREVTDDALRAALERAHINYTVVSGLGPARLAGTLTCVERALSASTTPPAISPEPRWQWHCERCGDADCERRSLFACAQPGTDAI